MRRNTWIEPLLQRLLSFEGPVTERPADGLAPARLVTLAAADWGRLGQQAKAWGLRWAAGWAEDHRGEELHVYACFEKEAGYLLARTTVPMTQAELPSHTPFFPGADRSERHIQDMFGIRFADHPDNRRWTRHQAWTAQQHPLRKTFPAAGVRTEPTPPDDQYPFLGATGRGVYEIPVGPVHAGIIEPGHFRFQAVGETVLNLEEHLGYVHKGIEKIAEGRDPAGLARLAGRVSGDSTVHHAWAACMAMERAAQLAVPERALWLRAVMAERERVANHLGDIGAICNDVAFSFAFYQMGRLREQWQRVSHDSFGHRFMMDCIVPGGVAVDIDAGAVTAMRNQITALRQEFNALMTILDEIPTLADRLVTTGVLSPELAALMGTLGYVGRASGQDYDLRRDAPYAPYDRLKVRAPALAAGDVAARVQVRAEEIRVSLDLLEQMLGGLPAGPIRAAWRTPAPDAEGLGLIDGWRGEILVYVRFAADGTIARYYPRDPSVMNWPALEKLVRDNIVPDFPVCNKSVNGSYSGNDL